MSRRESRGYNTILAVNITLLTIVKMALKMSEETGDGRPIILTKGSGESALHIHTSDPKIMGFLSFKGNIVYQCRGEIAEKIEEMYWDAYQNMIWRQDDKESLANGYA